MSQRCRQFSSFFIQKTLLMLNGCFASTLEEFKFALFMLLPICSYVSMFTLFPQALTKRDSHMVQSLKSECETGFPSLPHLLLSPTLNTIHHCLSYQCASELTGCTSQCKSDHMRISYTHLNMTVCVFISTCIN